MVESAFKHHVKFPKDILYAICYLGTVFPVLLTMIFFLPLVFEIVRDTLLETLVHDIVGVALSITAIGCWAYVQNKWFDIFFNLIPEFYCNSGSLQFLHRIRTVSTGLPIFLFFVAYLFTAFGSDGATEPGANVTGFFLIAFSSTVAFGLFLFANRRAYTTSEIPVRAQKPSPERASSLLRLRLTIYSLTGLSSVVIVSAALQNDFMFLKYVPPFAMYSIGAILWFCVICGLAAILADLMFLATVRFGYAVIPPKFRGVRK